MTFRQRQLTGWRVLAVAALAAGGWLATLDYQSKISTDVLDLIPSGERAPELALVRELASEAEAKTMLFVLNAGDVSPRSRSALPGIASALPVSEGAADLFAAELVKSGSFVQAMRQEDTAGRDALGKELFDRRFTLLFPTWLAEREKAYVAALGEGGPASARPATVFSEWLAKDAAEALRKFVSTNEVLAFQDIVPADPLLLTAGAALGFARALQGVDTPRSRSALPGIASALPGIGSALPDSTLVWARLAHPPLTEAAQGPAFAAIDAAVKVVREKFPGMEIADTGVNRFAAASRARIEHEVSLLNTVSLVAVLMVAVVFLRSAWRSLHLVPVLGLSLLGAWTVSTMVFPRIHILVFAVGSLLAGVAVDYGFYLYMQPPATDGEPYPDKVRRLLKPLLASCFTTVAGFALLMFSELPLIRQLGLFVGAGLICALGAAIIYFGTLPNPYLEPRRFGGGAGGGSGGKRWLRRALIAVWIVALPGLLRIDWRDDIRQLEIPSPELRAKDARIRAQFGESPGRTVYLSYGSTLAEARESTEKFRAWLTSAAPTARVASLASAVPTAAANARAVKFAKESTGFPAQFKAALGAADFDVDAFAPFFEAYARFAAGAKESDVDEAVSAVQAKLTGPMSLLVHSTKTLSWFVTIVEAGTEPGPPAETKTMAASQLQTLNELFARYRASAVRLSLIGLAMVGAGVLATYGLRDGIRIFAIPCGACLGLFGIFGWIGQPLNLFHLLGAFLGVCLTHNYSIFSVTSAYRREPPPPSVRLSALTAAASFGVLALSGIPVVRALGSTVSLMVLAALLVIEFEHFAPIADKK